MSAGFCWDPVLGKGWSDDSVAPIDYFNTNGGEVAVGQ